MMIKLKTGLGCVTQLLCGVRLSELTSGSDTGYKLGETLLPLDS